MANYHLSIKIFSRNKGASAMEKAAYRAGEKLVSDYNGETYDYTRKHGVVHTEILLPEHAPTEYADRTTLWNAVENSERNSNAQLARELEISLPVELTREQNIALAREYVQNTFVSVGMCADVCVHDKNDGNPHAHIMLTLRPFNADGTWAAKSRKEYVLDKNGERIRLPSGEYKSRKVNAVDWHDKTKAEEWRAAWADAQNAALERYAVDAQTGRKTEVRVDHRSYQRQGIDKTPTIHLGPAAAQMEHKGIRTNRGDINRAVEVTNSNLAQQRARIKKAKDWLYAVPIQNAPTMVAMMNRVADAKNLTSRAKKIRNLQTQAKVLMFLQHNDIADMEQLAGKVERMSHRHYEVANDIKSKTRRINTLTHHLEQCEIQKQHRAVYQKYRQLDPKKRSAYAEKHAEEIRLYKEACDYIKAALNGKVEKPPVKAWQAELAALTSERFVLCDEYYRLDDDLRSVEALRRGAEQILREETERMEKVAALSPRGQGVEM